MNNKHLFLIFMFVCMFACTQNEPSCDFFIQIDSDGKTERICLEIDKVGIDERRERAKINIHTTKQFIQTLKDITGKNLGKTASLLADDKRLFSGIIQEELEDGILSFEVESIKDAIPIVEKIGSKKSYHLKLTPEEKKAQQKINKVYANPWHKKASEAMNQGDYVKAIEFQKKAIEEMPNKPEHYSYLSFIYYLQGDLGLALAALLKAEKLVKKEDMHKYQGIYLGLGDYYTKLKNYDAAIDAYHEYLSTGKTNLLIRLNLGKVYEKIGKYDLAIKEYIILSKSKDEEIKKEGLDGLARISKEGG